MLQEFKKALFKKAQMTPEEFYRTCDITYQMVIPVSVFESKLKSFNYFDISEKNIQRLIRILDEDMEGNITLHEYYNALEAYDCRGETSTPFDDDPMYASFQNMALYKLVKVLIDRNISNDELFRMIDVSNDGDISIMELKAELKKFGDFQEKELHAIRKFFDLDHNGSIDEKEFYTQIAKAEKSYQTHMNK